MARKNIRRGRRRLPDKPNTIPLVGVGEARAENEIFSDLQKLCQSPGYIHALSFLVYRSHIVFGSSEFTAQDFQKIYRKDRLIRSEVSVLIGLMIQTEIEVAHPGPELIQMYIDRTEALLAELHTAILEPSHKNFIGAMSEIAEGKEAPNPLTHPAAIRESAFYGSESAFTFQYIDFAVRRYKRDEAWLKQTWGFDIEVSARLMESAIDILSNTLATKVGGLREVHPNQWSMLSLFTFTASELADHARVDEQTVRNFLSVFSVPPSPTNQSYESIHDINEGGYLPFISLPDDRYAMFLEYVATEALYDFPYYMMIIDKTYRNIASRNRGDFGEDLTKDILERVFERGEVFKNVKFYSGKDVHSEADVVLLHGKRVFIFQIKSKRFTANAKRGDEIAISNDFKGAVQAAYDQSVRCVHALRQGLTAKVEGLVVDFPVNERTRYYPVCVTTEHYPALSYQVAQFLEEERSHQIENALVFDVFALDVFAEFLDNPLYFIDYLAKRSAMQGRVLSSHEVAIFAYHLRSNLFLEDNVDLLYLDDDVITDVDLSMAVRRRGIPGPRTPKGILTRDLENPIGRILECAKDSDRSEVHELGEFILSLSGDTWDWINRSVEMLCERTRKDGKPHDVSLPIEDGGLTIHVSAEGDQRARERLFSHTEIRKYAQKADRWFGVCLDVKGEVRLLHGNTAPWTFDFALEGEAQELKVRSFAQWTDAAGRRQKLRVNDPCPCESGKKYKKCHGRSQ